MRAVSSTHPRNAAQQLYDGRQHALQQMADKFGVPRSTVYGYRNRSSRQTARNDDVGPAAS
jgi:phage portal protein BeeE